MKTRAAIMLLAICTLSESVTPQIHFFEDSLNNDYRKEKLLYHRHLMIIKESKKKQHDWDLKTVFVTSPEQNVAFKKYKAKRAISRVLSMASIGLVIMGTIHHDNEAVRSAVVASVAVIELVRIPLVFSSKKSIKNAALLKNQEISFR